MAQNMLQIPELGFVNSRKAVPDAGGNDADLATPLNYTSVAALRARLTAISAVTYSTAVLEQMSVNDMIYAVRMSDDLSSFGL